MPLNPSSLFFRILLIGSLSLASVLLSSCSYLEKKRPPKSFHFERAWARKTVSGDYTGFRLNHRMSPVIFGEYVIQGNAVDGIQAYDRKSGHIRWKRDVLGGVEAGAKLKGSSLYFGGNDGFFHAIDAYTGRSLWSFPLRAEGIGAPAVEDSQVFFLAGNNMAYSLRADTGERVWFYNRNESANLTIRGASEPTVAGSLVLLGFSDGYLVALDKATGRVKWERLLSQQVRFRDVDAKPIVRDSKVYISSYDGRLYSLDLNTGKTLWTTDAGGFTSVTLEGDRLFTSTSDFRVVAVEASSGKTIWETQLDKTVASRPVYYRGLILFGEWRGDLVALDARTGELVNRYSTGRGLSTQTSIDHDLGLAYVMGVNGDLYAFKLKWEDVGEKWPWSL